MATIYEYNVLDMVGTASPLIPGGGSASTNTLNLQAMLNQLLDSTGPTQGQGGTLVFPPDQFAFSDTIVVGAYGGPQPFPIILRSSGASEDNKCVLQFENASDDFFKINTLSAQCLGGVVFQDLVFKYTGTGIYSVAAVRNEGSQNVRLFRCSIINFPIGVGLDNSLSFNMEACTIYTTLSTSIGLQLGAPDQTSSAVETRLAGNTFLGSGSGGAVGIQIYGCEHLRVQNCRIESFTYGIVISPTQYTEQARKLYFGNVSCFSSGQALTLSVSGGSDGSPVYISQVWFAECEFEPGGGSTAGEGPGIWITGADGTNNIIDQIRFVDCLSCLWDGPGLTMQGSPTNIEILGGFYSCNGNGTLGPNPWASSGIALVGPAKNVRISNVACNNSFFNIYLSTPAFQPATQKFGLYIANGPQSVRVNGCDFTGSVTNGLYVDTTTAPAYIYVKDCDFTGLANPVKVTTTWLSPKLHTV